MLAYDRRSFVNFTIQTEAQTWFDSKLLSQEQYGAVCQNFPCHFYAPTLFIRVTLFLATLIAISAGSGLLSLFLPGFSGSFSFAIRFMVFGGVDGVKFREAVAPPSRLLLLGKTVKKKETRLRHPQNPNYS